MRRGAERARAVTSRGRQAGVRVELPATFGFTTEAPPLATLDGQVGVFAAGLDHVRVENVVHVRPLGRAILSGALEVGGRGHHQPPFAPAPEDFLGFAFFAAIMDGAGARNT